MSGHASRNQQEYAQSLSLLAENELALESLYLEYARQHRSRAAFWQELAADERRHAGWIAKLADSIKLEDTPPGRSKPEAIRTFIAYLHKQKDAASRGEVPFEKAVIIASYIEDALIEQKYFEQLPLDDTRLKSVLAALKRETEQHSKKIKNAVAQVQQG